MFLLHAAWLTGSVLVGCALIAKQFWGSGGVERWVVVGLFAYGVVSSLWVIALMLRMRWNAPEAERRNRELLGSRPEP